VGRLQVKCCLRPPALSFLSQLTAAWWVWPRSRTVITLAVLVMAQVRVLEVAAIPECFFFFARNLYPRSKKINNIKLALVITSSTEWTQLGLSDTINEELTQSRDFFVRCSWHRLFSISFVRWTGIPDRIMWIRGMMCARAFFRISHLITLTIETTIPNILTSPECTYDVLWDRIQCGQSQWGTIQTWPRSLGDKEGYRLQI
jgi:hypothetical protein